MSQKEQLSNILKSLLNKGVELFYLLKKDTVGELLTDEGYALYGAYRDRMKVEFVISMILLNFTVPWYTFGVKQIRGHLEDLLAKWKSITKLPDHSVEETQEAINRIMPGLHLFIGKNMLCEVLRKTTAPANKSLLEEANHHLQKADSMDLVQKGFIDASYLYKIGQYVQCYDLLFHIYNTISENSITACVCTRRCYFNPSSSQWVTGLLSMTAEEIDAKIAQCVFFLPSEKELAPVALHPEMDRSRDTLPDTRSEFLERWFDYAVVDAIIYLHFMTYLVSKELDNIDRKEFAVLELDRLLQFNLGHKDTAFNLLGWIHKEENRIGDALRCFLESWNIRPDHNAAKFHMGDMVDKIDELLQQWEKRSQITTLYDRKG